LGAYDYPSAAAINDAGDIVGYTWEGSEHALFWPRDGGVRTLATLRERDSSGAVDINNHGLIVGWSGSRAVVWENGRPRALPGDGRSVAQAINDRAMIVGSAGERAALWENGMLRILAGTKSAAVDINNRGQVVGWRTGPAGKVRRGFLWENGAMVDLAGFIPEAINDRGQIVGSCSRRACVWQRGRITKLRDLGYSYPVATGINERQQIVGSGQAGGGQLMPYSVVILWTFKP
jgi:probable HAF family extracellular repeat protein